MGNTIRFAFGITLLALLGSVGANADVLREDTATQVAIGPFIDGTDGITAETALTVSEWDCDLIKHADTGMTNTALTITASGGSNDAAHLTSGMYALELTATDTNTAGRLVLICDHATPATFLAIRHEWMVMPTQQYDSLYAGTDVLQVHATEMSADLITASVIAASAIGASEVATDAIGGAELAADATTEIQSGLATASALTTVDNEIAVIDGIVDNLALAQHTTTIATLASQTSFTLTAGSADDNAYNGWEAVVTDQSTSTQKAVGIVQDYTGTTKTVTLMVDPGIFTMAAGDTITLRPANANVRQINCREVSGSGTTGVEWAGTGDGGC